MKPFSEIIKIDGESLHLRFYNIHTIKGEKFFVTVTRGRESYVFDMMKNGLGKWGIFEPAPEWIRPFEEQLSYIIDQNITT